MAKFALDTKRLNIILVCFFVYKVSSWGYARTMEILAEGPFKWLCKRMFLLMKMLPGTKQKIEAESAKMEKKMTAMVMGHHDQGTPQVALPPLGISEAKIMKQLTEWQEVEEGIWKTGQVSGTVYHGGDAHNKIVNKAVGMFSLSNPLHPDVFPYVRKMEAEVVAMTLSMFHADLSTACGTTTSGGTESILMATKAYRDMAKAERNVENPEMVVPETIHTAFDKAAAYFGIKLIKIKVNQTTFKADVAAMKRAVNGNTIALAASAPSFPQGVIDDITELAAYAKSYGIGMHVDSCLGGYLLPFVEGNLTPFDFRVPGVTSISADCHKYGYCPKGVSTILYASKSLRRYQYFVAAEWTGGIYASPTIAGSRPGGLVVGAWTAMMTIGTKGYMEMASEIMKVSRHIQEGIKTIPGVKVLGRPDMSVVCFASDENGLDIYKVGEQMSKFHWNLNSLQYPASIHICLTYIHRDKGEKFLADLKSSVEMVRSNPNGYRDGSAAIYGLAESIPDKSMVDDLARSFIDSLYKTSAE